MSAARTAASLLGAVALLAPLGVLGAAPAAQAADSDFSSPAAGQVFSGAPQSIPVTAKVPACTTNIVTTCPTVHLAVSSDGQTLTKDQQESRNGASTVTVSVGTTSGGTIRANGTWTATLSGGSTGSRTFSTNFDPATPGGPFQVISSDPKNVSFSWGRGAEADLTGYTLSDTTTGQSQDVALSACGTAPGSGCSGSFYYPSGSPGSHTYTLVASRKQGCPGCSGTLQSSPATTSATLDAAPSSGSGPTASPSPGSSPAPSGGGGSAGGTGGGTAGSGSGGGSSGGGATGTGSAGSGSTGPSGSGTAAPRYVLPSLRPANPRQAYALSFNAFAPSLGIPKLPPLPVTTYAGEQPLPLGTYKPSLPYSPQTETTKTTSLLSSPTAFVSSIDSSQLAKSLATALILLLVGAHVRRFLGTHVED